MEVFKTATSEPLLLHGLTTSKDKRWWLSAWGFRCSQVHGEDKPQVPGGNGARSSIQRMTNGSWYIPETLWPLGGTALRHVLHFLQEAQTVTSHSCPRSCSVAQNFPNKERESTLPPDFVLLPCSDLMKPSPQNTEGRRCNDESHKHIIPFSKVCLLCGYHHPSGQLLDLLNLWSRLSQE